MAIDDFSILHTPRDATQRVSVGTACNTSQLNIVGAFFIGHRQIPHGRSIQITEKADIFYRGRGYRHSGNGLAVTIEGALKAFSVVGV